MNAHGFPVYPTPFIGRDKELNEIAGLLADPSCRLLTLTGSGGMGKTSLALQAAAHQGASATYADGVYIVPLQALTSPVFVIPAIANALMFSFYDDQNPKTQLLNYLREKRLLLVLDNFEHLLDARNLLLDMLERIPGVKILATSRERLRLREEWVFSVGGLNFPDSEDEDSVSIENYPAGQLFTLNARRVGYVPKQDDIPFIARICRAVEGIPLAIELAAAWTHGLPCSKIADEIERCLDILETPLHNVTERHRSMRASFEHSWHLLSDKERAAFARLSVFRGGFTQQAAQKIADVSLPVLVSLVNKSLLQLGANGRYKIHELLKQSGEEKLSPDEKEQTQALHCQYYAAFMQTLEAALKRSNDQPVLDAIAEEFDNILGGWSWATERGAAGEISSYIVPLSYFYGQRRLAIQGEKHFSDAIARFRAVEPSEMRNHTLARLLTHQGWFLHAGGQHAEASVSLEESISFLSKLDLAHRADIGIAFAFIARVAHRQGSHIKAKQYLNDALAIFREVDTFELCVCLMACGEIAYAQGEYQSAMQFCEEGLIAAKRFGHSFAYANLVSHAALTSVTLKEYIKAKTHLRESLLFQKEIKLVHALFFVNLLSAATLLADFGYHKQAVKILAIILYHPLNDALIKSYAQQLILKLEAKLVPEDITAMIAEANSELRNIQHTTPPEFVDHLLALVDQPRASNESVVLNSRELEILHLIADGHPNREIAEKLFLAPSTVKWYCEEIYSKLNVHSRTQAVARARELKLLL